MLPIINFVINPFVVQGDARVVFDYDAEADDELTLKEGDLIRNIVKKEDGWWEGELRGRRGMFPENFVEEIKKSDTREEKALKKPDGMWC